MLKGQEIFKRLAGFSLIIVLLLPAGQALAGRPEQLINVRGSIRGGVYEDVDGDGFCVEGSSPVTGVSIAFDRPGIGITLLSGENGTFGLVAAGQGEWRVSARPPAGWQVTSANPLFVEISPAAGLTRTGVNFCVQRTDSSKDASLGPDLLSRTLRLRLVTGELIEPPAANDFSEAAATTRAVLSEQLLTRPPAPEPVEVVAAVAETLPAEPEPEKEPWLAYLNQFRAMGGLPALVENGSLTRGAQLHSRYMVVNDKPIAHNQDQNNPLFDPAGRQAAINGNIFATTQIEADDTWSTNFWISAPFHLVPILDPELGEVGFGRHNQAIGTFRMAAVLDVRSGLGRGPGGGYPLYFPGNGSETWVVRHSLYEWPDPTAACPGFARPTGPALVVQLGEGGLSPRVSGYRFLQGQKELEACAFSESTYTSGNPAEQRAGRLILDERDAIVVLPRRPLAVGETYTVEVVVDGQTYSWQFATRSGPP